MFGLGKKRVKNSRLEELLQQIVQNASNNYKDAAQTSLRSFEAELKKAEQEGTLTEKQRSYYEEKLGFWKDQLKKFTHADQKASW